MVIRTAALSTVLSFGLSGLASAVTLDFESGLPAEVSGFGSVTAVGGLDGLNGFSGSFLWNQGSSGQSTDISVSGLAAHDTVTLTFGLALIDSWDAIDGTPAPDYFNIVADGTEVFEISVANASGTTEVIPAGATNRSSPGQVFGNTGWTETLFDVSFSFAHVGGTLDLSLFADGTGWQAGLDESWGIDNFSITTSSTNVVPLPAGGLLLLGGLGLLALRRRG